MGKVYDLLKAAIAGKSDTLAKWREAVSLAIDGDQVGTGTGVIQVVRTTNGAALVAGVATAVLFDGVRAAENAAVAPAPIGTEEILYTAATGVFTLTPGLYELTANLVFNTFGTVASDHVIFHWAASGALAVPLALNVVSDVYPPASTVVITGAPTNKLIYRVVAGANQTVVVSATALTGANTTLPQGQTAAPPTLASAYAIVRKLS